ncbi:MAG: CPBP family intramembrane metalloprotease [Bacteroidales bacterium]|nr:CPBP family intramembrane metalloprotease [Bacteroidales bacterium]
MIDTLLGVLLGIIIYVCCYIIKILQPRKDLSLLKSAFSKNENKILICVIAFSNTMVEELVLRSYILHLSLLHFSVLISVFINCVSFYIIHLDRRFIALTISTLLYCVVVMNRDNVLPSIIAHLIYNFMVFFKVSDVIARKKI